MSARVLMFQGTGSDVGKSTLTAGLCRIALRRGIKVAPFKPQNMSNNAAACNDGGEIGRAQALQARAAALEPNVHFNPVLLKPQSDQHAQVVVHGKVQNVMSAKYYMDEYRNQLMDAVLHSFSILCESYDLILVEGAGSASEVNLRDRDIANMGFAQQVKAPVCLIGDIDRGGVIASVVGTKAVIDEADAQRVVSFLINRFRGDPRLFDNGVTAIEQLTGWPCRGVVPWIPAALNLPQEDAVILEKPQPEGVQSQSSVRVAVPMLSRIANFDDMDPLRFEPNVDVGFVPPGKPIPADIDAIIIPGTKSALADLAFLKAQGWDHDIISFARRGGKVIGVCGGYQLMGQWIHDPHGLDGNPGSARALGLLNVETLMQGAKQTHPVTGHCTQSQSNLSGYEIHIGNTTGSDTNRPMTILNGKPDGAISQHYNCEGTYLHGVFNNDAFRAWWLNTLKSSSASDYRYEASIEKELDTLADRLEETMDVDSLLADAKAPRLNSLTS